jgi:hypothetical protein
MGSSDDHCRESKDVLHIVSALRQQPEIIMRMYIVGSGDVCRACVPWSGSGASFRWLDVSLTPHRSIPMNGRTVFYVLLLCLWLYWAAMAYRSGDTQRALILLAIGVALTAFRFRRATT